MASLIKIAEVNEIVPDTAKAVDIHGKKIAVFNVKGEFFALDDACPHRGGPLSEGTIEGESVVCPWHAALFNLKTGETSGPPSPRGVTAYPIVVKDSSLYIELP